MFLTGPLCTLARVKTWLTAPLCTGVKTLLIVPLCTGAKTPMAVTLWVGLERVKIPHSVALFSDVSWTRIKRARADALCIFMKMA